MLEIWATVLPRANLSGRSVTMALCAVFGWLGTPLVLPLWSMKMPGTQKILLRGWMERCCVALGFVWSCQLECHERPSMAAPVADTLTPKTAVTSVGTGATMLMTATASARGGVAVGADPVLVPVLAPVPDRGPDAIDPAPAAMAGPSVAHHPILSVGTDPTPLPGPSPRPLCGVIHAPVLAQCPGPGGGQPHAPGPALRAVRDTVVPDLQARKKAQPQAMIEDENRPHPLQPTSFGLAAVCFSFVLYID